MEGREKARSASALKLMRCNCRAHNGFLTAKGLEEAAQRFSLEGVAPRGEGEYVDRVGSVSALVEGEGAIWLPELQLEEQYRRFHNGS